MEKIYINVRVSYESAVRNGSDEFGDQQLPLKFLVLSPRALEYLSNNSRIMVYSDSFLPDAVARAIETKALECEKMNQAIQDYLNSPIESRIECILDKPVGSRWFIRDYPPGTSSEQRDPAYNECRVRNKSELVEYFLSRPIEESIVFSEYVRKWAVSSKVPEGSAAYIQAENEANYRNDCLAVDIARWESEVLSHGTDSQRERFALGILPSEEFDLLVYKHYFPQLPRYEKLMSADFHPDCDSLQLKVKVWDNPIIDSINWERIKKLRAMLESEYGVPAAETIVRRHVLYCSSSCSDCDEIEKLSLRITKVFPGGRKTYHQDYELSGEESD